MNNIKLTFFTYLLIVMSLGVGNVNGLRCYICGENEEERSCQDFETSKDSYAKECEPPNDQGCKTETLGGKVIKRTCIKNNFNQCVTANKVVYCFCTIDLCNGNITTAKFFIPTDDEDLLEGSGIKTVPTTTENPKITHKIKSVGAVTHVSHFIFFVSFIIFMVTI